MTTRCIARWTTHISRMDSHSVGLELLNFTSFKYPEFEISSSRCQISWAKWGIVWINPTILSIQLDQRRLVESLGSPCRHILINLRYSTGLDPIVQLPEVLEWMSWRAARTLIKFGTVPRLTSNAAVMMWASLACRKINRRSMTGTTPDAIMSRNTRPQSTEGSWSGSPTSSSCNQRIKLSR